MKHPRRFFDTFSQWLTGEPADVLVVLSFTMIVSEVLFVVWFFLWVLHKQVITLEGLYYLCSVIFFGVAGWLGWREFYVSKRAEQIEQLDSLNHHLVNQWEYVSGDELQKDFKMVLDEIADSPNPYGDAWGAMPDLGEKFGYKLSEEYFRRVQFLSSVVRDEIDLYLAEQKKMVDAIAERIFNDLCGFSDDVADVNMQVLQRIEGLQNHSGWLSLSLLSGESPFSAGNKRPWQAQSPNSHQSSSVSNMGVDGYLANTFESVSKEVCGNGFKWFQRSLLVRLEATIQQELKRLVRSQ